MADDIHNLVLSPFREIVSKGNKALENATEADDQSMIKAARSLVNNAERALNKVEPVCKRQLDEYQSSFIDALKENDDITSFREQLNDMLWDLDDCIGVDNFDAEIYSKLQTLLRTAALKISDILVRMKLEYTRANVTLSPRSERPRTPSIIVSPSEMEAKAGPVQGWEEGELAGGAAKRADSPTVRPEDTPSEPPEDPWRGTTAESLTLKVSSLSTEDAIIQRRPRISTGGHQHQQQNDDQVSPLTPDHEATTRNPFTHRPVSAAISTDNIVSPIDDDPRNSFVLSPDTMPSSPTNQPPSPARAPPPIPAPALPYEQEAPIRPAAVTDAEGLIPVETSSRIHDQKQVQITAVQEQEHYPTVVAIEAFPPKGVAMEGGETQLLLPPDYHQHRHGHPRMRSTSVGGQARIQGQEGEEEGESDVDEQRRLPLLQFLPGTKIVGVSFPARYAGEWATGWAGETRGVFPMECVRMEMPRGDLFKGLGGGDGGKRGGSGMSVVARWKHVPTGGTGSKGSRDGGGFVFGGDGLQWLRFEKGEVITGVSFPHPQHWCWAGHNARGKWGIFPRAFMTPGTLLEEGPSNLLQLLHKEGHKRTGSGFRLGSSILGGNTNANTNNANPALGSGGGGGLSIGVAGMGSVLSRISSKGLGLRRLSSGNSNNSNGRDGGGGSAGTGGNSYHNWSASASEEPPPDSPSGSYYTTPGSAGSSSTRSPRPSLY